MATSVSSLNNVQGAKGVGLHNNNSNNSTPRNDSSQPAVGSAATSLHHSVFLQNCNMESNSSVDSDANAGGSQSFPTNQQPHLSPNSTKKDKQKRRKQSRPHRIPNSEDESQNQVLNLSKESKSTLASQTSPKTGSNSFSSLFPNFGLLGQPQQYTSTTSSNSSSSPVNTLGGANTGMGSNSVPCHSTQGSIPPPRIFNPEAFCDLCNKEFCNKYFLKTHKANKHGVYFDPPSQGTSSNNSTTTNGNYFSPTLAGGGSNIGTDNSESWCSYCQKDFQTKYFLRRHSIRVHGVPLPRGSSGDDDEDENEDEQEVRENEQSEPVPINIEIERGGVKPSESKCSVPNPSSHPFSCSFCSKDFSSESHLRLHITKKHGLNLQVPPFLLPYTTPAASHAGSLFYSADSFLGGIISKGVDHPYECHRCSRSFSTIYLLRMHNSYFHPVASPPPSNNNNDKGATEESIEEYDQKENIKEECFTPEGGTSDSDDLRRLQTMLIGLNPASSGHAPGIAEDFVSSLAWNPATFLSDLTPPPGVSNTGTVCPICSQEFYSPTILTQHIEQVHSNSDGKDTNTASQQSPDGMNASISNLPLNSQGFLLPPPSGGGSSGNAKSITPGLERRPSPSLSRSYCTICHKELCNKYFMRTHMLKMHGISIESSTGLGGVTCDICNKELCSKYFLKVHKQNTHGIVDEGPSPPAVVASQQYSEDPNSGLTSAINTPPPRNLSGCSAENSTVISGSNVSNNTSVGSPLDLHTNEAIKLETISLCPICSKSFKNSKLMKLHLQNEHGTEARDKWKESRRYSKDYIKESSSPSHKKSRLGGKGGFQHSGSKRNGGTKEEQGQTAQRLLLDPLGLLFGKTDGCNIDSEGSRKTYKCSFCPFTTPLLVYLYAHERTHTGLVGATRSGSQITASPLQEPYLQCPMCFQTYSNLETFQHHLLSHGMSGVLAPFLPQPQPLPQGDEEYSQLVNGKREANQRKDIKNGHKRQSRRRKIVYGCSACHYQFEELGSAEEHVSTHNHSQYIQLRGKGKLLRNKRKGLLQCRKCRFSTTSYYKLQLHSKGFHLFGRGISGSRKMIQLLRREKGVVLQRFLMTEDEKEGNERGIQSSHTESSKGNKKGPTGQFVPSFVYLPVHKKFREKVQVSFSLRPQP